MGRGITNWSVKELNPVLARKENDNVETLTIDIVLQEIIIKGRGYLPDKSGK